MKPGEILVVDNLRVLHGREAFVNQPEKPRCLRRVWIADEDITFVNPVGQKRHQRVFDQYESYCCLELGTIKPLISVSTGIRLSRENQAHAQQLLVKFPSLGDSVTDFTRRDNSSLN